MNIINTTPHEINIRLLQGTLAIPPSGTIARVAVEAVPTWAVDGIPVTVQQYGEVEGLPLALEIPEDTIYLVSGLVLSRLGSEYQGKVFAPDTSPAGAVRNESGQIIGVKGLVGIP